MNNAYTIRVGAPLLRPGLTITTVVSRGYLEDAVTVLMDVVREINHPTPPVETTRKMTNGERLAKAMARDG